MLRSIEGEILTASGRGFRVRSFTSTPGVLGQTVVVELVPVEVLESLSPGQPGRDMASPLPVWAYEVDVSVTSHPQDEVLFRDGVTGLLRQSLRQRLENDAPGRYRYKL